MAVNLGDDADTTGAVYGQLAGALFGRKRFPKTGGRSSLTMISSVRWQKRLFR